MDTIQAIIRRFKLNVQQISSVPDSYSSEVYKLHLTGGESVYLKIPYDRDKLFREFRILHQLAGILPVPRVMDFWDGDEQVTGALLLSDLKGGPCSEQVDKSLSYQIGMIQAQLHAVPMPCYGVEQADGFQPLEQNDWRHYIRHQFEKQKEICSEILGPELLTRCILYFNEAFSHLQGPDGPCLIHMDFRPGNILINNNKVTGLIDFESARSGSTEIDFTKMNRYIWQHNPSSRKAYVQGYTSIRPLIDLNRVLPFYTFYDAFSAVAWCKRRGIENHSAFLSESISVLKQAVSR